MFMLRRRYMDPFIDNLQRFADSFGQDGKTELNETCSEHRLTLVPQDKTNFAYGGLVIQDGVLRIVFQENNLGTNVSDASKDFAQALKDAPPPKNGASPFNLVARNAVRTDYDPNIEEVRSAIVGLVKMPKLELNPNFEHNAAELAKLGKDASGWDQNIARATLDYFKSVQSVLEREKFGGDDMLQETFQEAVEKGQICVRIVAKLKD